MGQKVKCSNARFRFCRFMQGLGMPKCCFRQKTSKSLELSQGPCSGTCRRERGRRAFRAGVGSAPLSQVFRRLRIPKISRSHGIASPARAGGANRISSISHATIRLADWRSQKPSGARALPCSISALWESRGNHRCLVSRLTSAANNEGSIGLTKKLSAGSDSPAGSKPAKEVVVM